MDVALTPCLGTVLGSIHVLAHLILTANLRERCCYYPILQTRKPRHREVSPRLRAQGREIVEQGLKPTLPAFRACTTMVVLELGSQTAASCSTWKPVRNANSRAPCRPAGWGILGMGCSKLCRTSPPGGAAACSKALHYQEPSHKGWGGDRRAGADLGAWSRGRRSIPQSSAGNRELRLLLLGFPSEPTIGL